MEQRCILCVLHIQYHACWCSGDFRSQVISRHDTDPQGGNIPGTSLLTHWGAYKRQLNNHHCFRSWLVAWSAPSPYLNQWWNIVNWTLKNKRQQNSHIFIKENAFENIFCEMAAILSRPQCVNLPHGDDIWYDNDTVNDLLQTIT